VNSERAKEILLLYRRDGPEANDPEVSEALEQVKRDPELREWFDDHCERQSLIREHLKGIRVPESLKERILTEAAKRQVLDWWQRPIPSWAAAAAVVLLASVFFFFLQERTPDEKTFTAFRNRMVGQTQRMYPDMDMVTNDLVEIRRYLAARQWPADYILPQPLQKLAGIGCAALQWRSNKVSLVCLTSGSTSNLFLFVIDGSALSDPPPSGQPEFLRIGRLMSASWSQDGKTYILAGPGDEEFVRKYL